MLHIKDLTFSFGKKLILDGLSLHLPKGQISTLLGSSGSGKSTLFNIITGNLSQASGTKTINGALNEKSNKEVSYMMQEDLMLPWRTVEENLLLINELGKERSSKKSFLNDIRYFLHEVGLSSEGNLYPDELSGGMRQRVSLARALLEKRPLLLLDEPFASLDIALREKMHALIREISNRLGTTVLLITHDFRDAATISDTIFLLKNKRIDKEWKTSPYQSSNIQSLIDELRSHIT